MIARCDGAGDVAAAFEFARAHDLEVAVRGGGHTLDEQHIQSARATAAAIEPWSFGGG